MNGWNFHGWIAVPLETYGKQCIGQTFFDADEIESGSFIEAMLQLLTIEYGDLSQVDDFVEESRIYADLPAREIPNEKAKELFAEFHRLRRAKMKEVNKDGC